VAGSDTTADWSALAILPPANTVGTFDELRIGSEWAAVTHLPWNTGDLLDASDTGVTLTGLTANSTTTFRLRAESTGGATVSAWSNTLTATTTTAATSTDWLVQHFATAFPEGEAAWTADPDADGLANILEYALGNDPTDPSDHSDLPVGTSGNHLTLAFTPQRVSGLRYFVESSSDLVGWNATEVTGSLTPGQLHTHTDSADLATTPRRFLRLRVVVP